MSEKKENRKNRSIATSSMKPAAKPPAARDEIDRLAVLRAAERIRAAKLAASHITGNPLDESRARLFQTVQSELDKAQEALAGHTPTPDLAAEKFACMKRHVGNDDVYRKVDRAIERLRGSDRLLLDATQEWRDADDKILTELVSPALQLVDDALEELAKVQDELGGLGGAILYEDARFVAKSLGGNVDNAYQAMLMLLSPMNDETRAQCIRLLEAFATICGEGERESFIGLAESTGRVVRAKQQQERAAAGKGGAR